LGRGPDISFNKLIKEWVSRNGAGASRLRVIYLPVKYGESEKSSISVLVHATENPKNGGDARNPACKYMCFYMDRAAQRDFL
jgi:hypothetical protein